MSALFVERLDLWRYELPLARPLRTAQGILRSRRGLILRLEGQERSALGEAAPLPRLSVESLDEVEAALGRAVGRIQAQPLESVDDVRALLEELALPSSAAHAVDQALLGLLAGPGGRLAALLSPAPRAQVPVHALVTGPEDAAQAVKAGLSCLKVKVGRDGLDADLARLRAIRGAAGSAVALRLDANGAYQASEAIQAIRRFEELGADSIEQPVPAGDLAGMARVRSAVSLPIAADESVRTAADLEALIAAEAADAVVLKPMLAGGLLASHRLLERAALAGLAASVTTSLESAIGRAAATELAAACPGTLWTCGLETGRLLRSDLSPERLLAASPIRLRSPTCEASERKPADVIPLFGRAGRRT
jgi:o-succinylbenzoate synthase